jgi:hypothetical protein
VGAAVAEDDPVAGFVQLPVAGEFEVDVPMDGERELAIEEGLDAGFEFAPGARFVAVVAGHRRGGGWR